MAPPKVFSSTALLLVFAAIGALSCVAQPTAEAPVVADRRGTAFVSASASAAAISASEAVTVSPIAVAAALAAGPQVADSPTRPAVALETTGSDCVSGSILHAAVERRDAVKLRAPDSVREIVAPDCPSASLSLEVDPDPGGDAYPGPKTMFVWVLGLDWW